MLSFSLLLCSLCCMLQLKGWSLIFSMATWRWLPLVYEGGSWTLWLACWRQGWTPTSRTIKGTPPFKGPWTWTTRFLRQPSYLVCPSRLLCVHCHCPEEWGEETVTCTQHAYVAGGGYVMWRGGYVTWQGAMLHDRGAMFRVLFNLDKLDKMHQHLCLIHVVEQAPFCIHSIVQCSMVIIDDNWRERIKYIASHF